MSCSARPTSDPRSQQPQLKAAIQRHGATPQARSAVLEALCRIPDVPFECNSLGRASGTSDGTASEPLLIARFYGPFLAKRRSQSVFRTRRLHARSYGRDSTVGGSAPRPNQLTARPRPQVRIPTRATYSPEVIVPLPGALLMRLRAPRALRPSDSPDGSDTQHRGERRRPIPRGARRAGRCRERNPRVVSRGADHCDSVRSNE